VAKNLPRSLTLLAAIVLAISLIVRTLDSVPEDQSPAISRRPEFKLDVNSATVAQLVSIPRVGPKMARRIAQYRNQHGHLDSLDQLLEVDGVGPATLETLSVYLTAD